MNILLFVANFMSEEKLVENCKVIYMTKQYFKEVGVVYMTKQYFKKYGVVYMTKHYFYVRFMKMVNTSMEI